VSRRGVDEDTRAIGVGCIGLDVEMAREHGWTDDDINRTWDTISAAYGATYQQVAKRAGHTRRCPDCECWTVPNGPCHLCEQDRLTAEEHEAKPCRCSCGERFATLEEMSTHAAASGGLLHGDQQAETLTEDDIAALQYFKVFAEEVHEATAYVKGMDAEHGLMAQRAILALEKIIRAYEAGPQ
jgi:hypothetical protein